MGHGPGAGDRRPVGVVAVPVTLDGRPPQMANFSGAAAYDPRLWRTMRNITGITILLGMLEFTRNTGILLDLLGFI